MASDASERILGLVAYLDGRTQTETSLADIARDVPGYAVEGELTVGSTEWETVRKRLQRDLPTLVSSFGIIVDYDEERHNYRLRPPYFRPDERRALIAVAAAVEVDGIDDAPVLGELGAGVEEDGRRIVLSVPSRVRELSDAIRARRPVRFRYHGHLRTVDAYVIGRWRTRWYVAGYEHESAQRRRYRLDRIERPEAGTTADAVSQADDLSVYAIPDDIDPIAEMRLDPNDWGHDPLLVAHIEVENDHVHNVQHELGGRVVERATDRCVIEVDVRHYVSFCERVLAFGTHARVLAPPELVAAICDHLRAVATRSGAR